MHAAWAAGQVPVPEEIPPAKGLRCLGRTSYSPRDRIREKTARLYVPRTWGTGEASVSEMIATVKEKSPQARNSFAKATCSSLPNGTVGLRAGLEERAEFRSPRSRDGDRTQATRRVD